MPPRLRETLQAAPRAIRSRVLERLSPGDQPRRVIAYPVLGEFGQLGNQLWQIAGTLGIAATLRANVDFPQWSYRELFSVPDHYFGNQPPLWQDSRGFVSSMKPNFTHYLQDYSLWRHIDQRVRRFFSPSPAAQARMEEKFAELLRVPNKTALHVRRGDYLRHPGNHPVPTEQYYRAAVERLPRTNIVIFSDDIEWCRENLAWTNPVQFVDGNADHEDLFLISQCKHHVIANSSFSWWGAFLSRNRRPIYPRPWFGDELMAQGVDPTLMFPTTWIGLDD
ncbi:MAG TPA: alpha-1,2-fucosyltransferase [Candidatus Dormibacteraeota bacterium]